MAVDPVVANEKELHGDHSNGNGLVLYSYHHSYHSQKVLMALYEKNIPFTIVLVDVTKDEQYKPWFLKVNPWGSVPVLKDGIKFIPNSKAIIGYLEDNFSNGEYLRLIPIDQGVEVRQKIISYHDKISEISSYLVTLGTLVNNKWCSNFKYPFILSSIRRSSKAYLLSSVQKIRKHAINNLASSAVLLQKAKIQEKKQIFIADSENYVKLLEGIEDLLNEVEQELSGRSKDQSKWWLCTDCFTVADISLVVLLDRLSRLGMEANFWSRGVRPHVEMYYQRAQQRDSYKKTMPTLMTDVAFILETRRPIIIGMGFLTVIVLTVGGFFYFKK